MLIKKPELLVPAGNFEKLKIAILYGADAVYLSGHKFGLRTRSDNFSYEELKEGRWLTKQNNIKMYVTLNAFMHDEDLEELPLYLEFLEKIEVDAVIISDLGVISTVKKISKLPIHLSTQACCLNSEAGNFWKEFGIKRIVLGREVSIKEASQIKRNTGLEIEMFFHGSLCMAYSGNCTLSNYMAGRDSNRGGCNHSCRFKYSIDNQQERKTSYFLSSKDMIGLETIPQFVDYEIDSAKFEGRMKGPLYAATITKVYKEAIETYSLNKDLFIEKISHWKEELKKFSHRDYSTGNLVSKADQNSLYNKEKSTDERFKIIGQVLETNLEQFIIVEVKNSFNINDHVEFFTCKGENIKIKLEKIYDLSENILKRTKPSTLIKIPYTYYIEKGTLLRMEVL